MTPTFLGQVSRGLNRRYELVHVESGAVLESRVEVDAEDRPWWRRARRGAARVDARSVLVTPARWAHIGLSREPADIVLVGADGTVIKACRGVKPRRIVAARGAQAVIEAAPGFIERTATGVGDRLALREAQAARPLRDVALARSGVEEAAVSVGDTTQRGEPDAPWGVDDGDDPWNMGADDGVTSVQEKPALARPPAPAAAPVKSPAPPALSKHPPALPLTVRASAKAPGGVGVDLGQLVASQTPLAWFEAVAIAQELYAVILASAAVGSEIGLEAEDVAITPEGGIELRKGTPPGLPPVPQAARILLTLLGEAESLPVQLRLLALQEVSPTPSCKSVLELSTRLALFERPGRQTAIRDVYERFSRLPPRGTEPPVAAPAPAALTARTPPPWWRRRRVYALAGAAAVMAVTVATLVWLWPAVVPPPPGQADPRGPAAKAIGDNAASVAAALTSGARTVARWIGVVPAARPSVAQPAEVPASPIPEPAVAPRRPRPRTQPMVALPREADTAPSPAVAGPDVNVYSAADADVVPPSIQRSRLPSVSRQGTPPGDVPQVEVVVSPAGDVESVKLLTPSAGVMPAMMLSAIKTWRFDPARRHGLPVRYRLRVRLTNQ